MVFGTFDILHLGHIYLFRRAKRYGDKLVVVVARDVNAKEKRLFHNELERLRLLQQVKLVDRAVLGNKKDFYRIIRMEKPDVIALGYDQKPSKLELATILRGFCLNKIKLVQLPAYRKNKFKSRKMRKYVNQIIC